MEKTLPTLAYRTPQAPPPGRLTLSETDGAVQVVFPLTPTWLRIAFISVYFVAGAMMLAVAVFVPFMMPHSVGSSPYVFRAGRNIFIQYSIEGAVFWLVASYQLWMYRRFRNVPRTLTATREGVVRSGVGFWRVGGKKWNADSIKSVEVRILRGNLSWKRTAADLLIRRNKGGALRFRLISPDAELPGRIGERMAAALGCSFCSGRGV